MAVAPIDPAKLAIGTVETPSAPMSRPAAITSIAPSAAPADTPSVKGVARGLRSSACSTTPGAASVAPTMAAASTRGSRATKKICASTLSAQGIDGSNARVRLIDVLPTVGATTTAAAAAAAKSGSTDHIGAAGTSGRHRGARLSGTTDRWPVTGCRCTSASTS